MTRSERRLLRRTAIFGILLTVLVVLLDATDFFGAAERFAYDWRATHFQHFAGPPTSQLVHLDIDDAALETIGRWPWPRARLAEIVDELRLAGCKAVAFDVLFTYPEAVEYIRVNELEASGRAATRPSTRPSATPDAVLARAIDNDAIFAASLKRFGRAVVPLSLTLGTQQTATSYFARVRDILLKNPAIEKGDVAAALLKAGLTQEQAESALADFSEARREAYFERIESEVKAGHATLPEIRERILPGIPDNVKGSPQINTLAEQYEREQALLVLRKFSRPAGAPFPPMVYTDNEQPTIPVLGRASYSTGFVDYVPLHDGTVRYVPLYVNHRGHAFAQIGLALACATLDVDLNHLIISKDRITIPCPDGRRIDIPVRTQVTSKGKRFGMFFDIPWFGKAGRNEWETMYDFPAHTRPRQHMSLAYVYEAKSIENKIRKTNLQLIDGMAFFVKLFHGAGDAAAFRSSLLGRDLMQADAVVKDLDALMKDDNWQFFQVKPEDVAKARDEEEREQFQMILQIPPQLQQLKLELPRLANDLRTRRKQLHDELAGKAALLGYVSVANATDQVPTPLHPRCPGVVAHGAIFNAIMTGRFWYPSPGYVTVVLILLMGLLTTFFVARIPGWPSALAAALLAGLYLIVNCLVIFDYGRWIVPLAGPLIACVVVWAGCTFYRYLLEIRERKIVKDSLSSFVDPALVDYVLHAEQPILQGQQKELTIVFTDLAGFTTISETLKEKSIQIIKEYMRRMIPIVKRKNEAYLNKLLGDGIMFFFNAPVDDPGHAKDATVAVLEMQEAIPAFNQWLEAQGLPPVAMRAGVLSGTATVGNVGVDMEGLKYNDYTALGDNVNLASRLEGANKSFGTKILLHQRTVELLGDEFLVRPVGKIQVKGKQEWVMTYEPLARRALATEEQKGLAEMTSAVVNAFMAGAFGACLEATERLEKEAGPSKLTELYREQATEYLRTPPGAGFEGQIALHEK